MNDKAVKVHIPFKRGRNGEIADAYSGTHITDRQTHRQRHRHRQREGIVMEREIGRRSK